MISCLSGVGEARPAASRLSTQVMERNSFVASAAASRWPLSGFFLLYLTGQCSILRQVQSLSSTQGEGNANLHSVLWSPQQKMRGPIRTLRIAKTVSSGCFGALGYGPASKKLKTGSVKLRRVGFSNGDHHQRQVFVEENVHPHCVCLHRSPYSYTILQIYSEWT